ncbi:MAG: type II toxin-antitoxin system Phd/YefM family antitoxin [Desulfococcaceae bacterium]|jgi:antitoxin (DNA-binding transcriptional repressor) of toxin-antitoxin stability system|nr:type II toxin-antitoxin system Phd/YefM family antitoxin [Desulfococcaceae bacterium]
MKTIAFSDFRKKAAGFIDEVELGETLVLLRRGKPIAEIIPFSGRDKEMPSWKQTIRPLQMKGSDLSSAILEERRTEE